MAPKKSGGGGGPRSNPQGIQFYLCNYDLPIREGIYNKKTLKNWSFTPMDGLLFPFFGVKEKILPLLDFPIS